jgi:glucokinase
MGAPRSSSSAVLLAGDVGGTKTLLGLFEHAAPRPIAIAIHTYSTPAFASFVDILDVFARDVNLSAAIAAAAIGAAGPIVDGRARLTNIVWDISTRDVSARLGTERIGLMNDLEAMAASAEVLTPDEAIALQPGVARLDGNAVVIAAGTGLGQAYLHRVNGRLRPVASEGGHADYAPRSDREIELLKMLRADYGRAEVEHILSGPGLVNVYRFTHASQTCHTVESLPPDAWPAAISTAAMSSDCAACVEALDIFVKVYGAETGNLALRGVATGGVYVGGGIAPKILPALQDGRFLDAFKAKGMMSELVAGMPVKVIVNPAAGLLGAAVRAQDLLNT